MFVKNQHRCSVADKESPVFVFFFLKNIKKERLSKNFYNLIVISYKIPRVRNSNINKTSKKNSLVAIKILIAKIPPRR
jgi:hypothetical protein